MKSFELKHLAQRLEIDELKAGIALYQLFNGRFHSPKSNDQSRFLYNKIAHAHRNDSFQNFIDNYGSRNITHLLEIFSLTVHFWYCANNGNFSENTGGDLVRPCIVRSIHSVSQRATLHILVNCVDFNINNEDCYKNRLRLIVDSEYLDHIRNESKTFLKNLELFTEMDSSTVQSLWPSTFSIYEERKFAQIFKIGFEIWFIESNFCPVTGETVIAKKRVYKSKESKYITLQYVGLHWPEEKETVTPTDLFILKTVEDFKVFHCPNKYCFFNTNDKQAFDRHLPSCKNTTSVNYKQIDLTWETPKEYLIRNKLIPKYENFNFVSFDIETLGESENRFISEETLLVETHKVASIAIGSNFGGRKYRVFLRNDFSEESLIKLIHDFWSELTRLQIEHQKCFPPEFESAYNYLGELIDAQGPFGDSILHSCRRYIENLFKLKIVSFNGERFDLPIIFPALLKFWNIKKSTTRSDPLDIIRRGLGIMSLDFRGIKFIDCRNFFPYGSLDQMGKIFKVSDMKLCFPYQAYSTIEEMKQETDWPPYSDFHSTLKPYNDISNLLEKLHKAFLKAEEFFNISSNDFFEQLNVYSAFQNYSPSTEFPHNLQFSVHAKSIFNLDPILYVDSWIKFEELKHLNEVSNMADYLKIYNLIDVRVTSASFTKMVQLFHEKFDENLLEYPSLPGVAYRVLWRHFSTKINKPFTFSNAFAWVAADVRAAIQGGLTTVFHCHLEVGDTNGIFPKTVTHAKSGKLYKEFLGLDAANLYGFSISQELPTGMGLVYKKTETGFFDKKIMMGQQESPKSRPFSEEAIIWLSWCQDQPQFRNHKIEHALNGSERKIELEDLTFQPDGYCEINDEKHFFLFNGCFWHLHDCKTSLNSVRVKEDLKKQERFKKIEMLCRKYGTLHLIAECDWLKIKKNIVIENPFSVFLRQRHITEQDLIRAILDDKLFGMVKCNIRSPDHVIKRYMLVNYPPITNRVTPEEDMIGEHILARMKNSKKKIPQNQLTQVSLSYISCF